MSAVLRKTTAPIVAAHFRNVCLGEARSSTLHRPFGQRSAARHSLWAGHARTPLRLRSILSGSVHHFVTDTSSEGERRRETMTDGVPLLSTPSLTDSQSGIAPLTLRSICAGPIRSRASVPPPPLRHSSPFRRSGSHVRSTLLLNCHSTIRARAGKTATSRQTVVPSGSCRACRLACSLSGRQKERCFSIALSDFRRVERWDIRTLLIQCIMEPHHTQGVRTKSIFISNRKHSRASATRFVRIVFRFDILVIVINLPYATCVVKTCNALSPYAEISS